MAPNLAPLLGSVGLGGMGGEFRGANEVDDLNFLKIFSIVFMNNVVLLTF